jgi:hypothetical protein
MSCLSLYQDSGIVYVLHRAWSQGQRCILPICPLEAVDVASQPAYVRAFHLTAGPRICTPCMRNHRAGTCNPRTHWTESLASELTSLHSSRLQGLGADTRMCLPDNDDLKQYLTCVGLSSIQAECRWQGHRTLAAKARCLRACVRVEGQHFEQLLNWTLLFLV